MSRERFAAWMHNQRAALKPVPSQEQIAEIIGVSQETISKWERQGVGELSPRTIRRIAACYKVDPYEVAGLLDYPVAPRMTARLVPGEERPSAPVAPLLLGDPDAPAVVRLLDGQVRRTLEMMRRLLEREHPSPDETERSS